jgi:hypothetical protein
MGAALAAALAGIVAPVSPAAGVAVAVHHQRGRGQSVSAGALQSMDQGMAETGPYRFGFVVDRNSLREMKP